MSIIRIGTPRNDIITLSASFFLSLISLQAIGNNSVFLSSSSIKLFLFLSVFFFYLMSGGIRRSILFFILFFSTFLVLGQLCPLLNLDPNSFLMLCVCLLTSGLIAHKLGEGQLSRGKFSRIFLLIHSALFLFLPIFLFRSFGKTSNLATFLNGWDHTGAHFYISKITRENESFSYLPADYIGANPKLLHKFMGFFMGNPISAFEDFQIILFFEFFFSYSISLVLISLLNERREVRLGSRVAKLNFVYLIFVSAIPFWGTFLAWIIGYGYPTILFAAFISLSSIAFLGSDIKNTYLVRAILVLHVVLIGNSWNPALPGALLVLFVYHLLESRNVIKLLLDSGISALGIFLPSYSIYINSGSAAISAGSGSDSIIFTLSMLAGLIIALFALFGKSSRLQKLLGSFVVGNLLFAVFIKFISGGTLFNLPYYSVKLLWISSIPVIVLTLFSSRKLLGDSVVQICFTAISALMFFVSNVHPIFPGNYTSLRILMPLATDEVVWQAKALKRASELPENLPYVVYSGSAWDSRSSQFSAILGRNTWSAQSALFVDTNGLCKFVIENPRTRLVMKENIETPHCTKHLSKIIVN